MEPVTMIVSAIATGALAAGKNLGGLVVKDAYDGLKARIVQKFKGAPEAEKALASTEQSPDDKEALKTLAAQLEAAGAGSDKDLMERSGALLGILQEKQIIIVTGSRITFQGSGAVAAGTGAIAAGRGASVQTGGIRAKNIRATNVVDGIQIQGGDAGTAESMASLAKVLDLSSGGIDADDIRAQNIVSGLQFIADPQNATPDQLRQEIGALRKNVEQAVRAGDIPDKADAEDLEEALDKAETELEKPEPRGKRVVRSLKIVTEILDETAKTLKAGGDIQAQALKLAPTAAAIYGIAQTIL